VVAPTMLSTVNVDAILYPLYDCQVTTNSESDIVCD